MAGKSLDQIWQQQQAQRQAQIAQQQARERALYEQRERARQDYLERMRMNERLSLINPSAAAASAGGSLAVPVEPSLGSGTIVFNGVDQYVMAPNDQVVTWLPGTGDFTIEWFMKKGVGGTSFPRVFSLGIDTSATIGCSIEGGTCYIWPYGGDLSGSMPAGYNNGTAWTHIAICRSGTTTKLFIDGVLKKTKTGDSRNINDSINPGSDLYMGVDDPLAGSPNWWSGNLTNFRWDNSAIYTGSSLTVPTAPLSQTATTKLLMLGGTVTNPVSDATGINALVNNGATWNSDTPFV